VVDRDTWTIELTAEHLSADWHAKHITSELTMGVGVINVCSTFKDLNKIIRKTRQHNENCQATSELNLPGRLHVFQRFPGLVLYVVVRLRVWYWRFRHTYAKVS
jgi:hypothetical protein